MNNPLGVSPSQGNQGTTRGEEKSFDLGGNRTHDLRIRSSVTLPTELRGRTEKVGDDLGGESRRTFAWWMLCRVAAGLFMGSISTITYTSELIVPPFVFLVLRGTTFIIFETACLRFKLYNVLHFLSASLTQVRLVSIEFSTHPPCWNFCYQPSMTAVFLQETGWDFRAISLLWYVWKFLNQAWWFGNVDGQ